MMEDLESTPDEGADVGAVLASRGGTVGGAMAGVCEGRSCRGVSRWRRPTVDADDARRRGRASRWNLEQK